MVVRCDWNENGAGWIVSRFPHSFERVYGQFCIETLHERRKQKR